MLPPKFQKLSKAVRIKSSSNNTIFSAPSAHLSSMDRVIAPPTRRDTVAAIVQPVQHNRPQPVLQKRVMDSQYHPEPIGQSRISETIGQSLLPAPIGQPRLLDAMGQSRFPEPLVQSRFPEPIGQPALPASVSRPALVPGTMIQSPIHSQQTFSKAPGTRPTGEFSRAPGAPANISANRNELFDEPSVAFGQFKPVSATSSNPLASTSSSAPVNDDTNGNLDNFDFSKLRMYDEGKIGNIWSSKPEAEEPSAWGGLFSQFLSPSNSTPLNATLNTNTNNTINTSTSETLGDWGNDFMSHLLGTPSVSNASSSATGGLTSMSQTSAPSNPGLSSLEQKGWMPASFAQSARDPNRATAPLFSRPQTNSSSSTSSMQQQQLQQLQQQQALQQQQRMQQMQQQFQQQQQHSPQSSLTDHSMNSKLALLQQQQQIYSQMQSLGQDPHGSNNIYSQVRISFIVRKLMFNSFSWLLSC